MPKLMTLDDLARSWCTLYSRHVFFRAYIACLLACCSPSFSTMTLHWCNCLFTTQLARQIWMNIHLNCQKTQYTQRPMSGNMWFMCIFAGVSWRGAINLQFCRHPRESRTRHVTLASSSTASCHCRLTSPRSVEAATTSCASCGRLSSHCLRMQVRH